MKLHQILYSIVLSLLLFACGNDKSMNNQTHDYAEPAYQTTDQVAEKKPNEPTVVESNRKLIKRGRVEFETKDLQQTKEQILKAVQQYDAYISSDTEQNSYGQQEITLEIRVPSKNFDNFLASATKGVSDFDVKEISIEDVTAQFIDVQARLNTKKALEVRYRDILKKANSVTEILEIEREIANLRQEIESTEGQLNYLKDQISFSTLTIRYYKELPVISEKRYNFLNGFKKGWNNLVWFILELVTIWPFILISFGLFYGLSKYRARRKVKRLK